MKQDKWWLKKEEKKTGKKMTAAKLQRNRLAGKLIWCSAELFRDVPKYGARWMKRVVQGTYIRKIHGPIGREAEA